eukprot:1742311-Pyramimonas_sp.AAC.1
MKGSATDRSGPHAVSTSSGDALRERKIILNSGELAVRRVRWLPGMIRYPTAHQQTIARICGHALHEPTQITEPGHIQSNANPLLLQFNRDLELYRG